MEYVVLGVVAWYVVAYYAIREIQRHNHDIYSFDTEPETSGGWLALWLLSPLPPLCIFCLIAAMVRASRTAGIPLSGLAGWMFPRIK